MSLAVKLSCCYVIYAVDIERSHNKTLPVISHLITYVACHLDFLPIVFRGRLQSDCLLRQASARIVLYTRAKDNRSGKYDFSVFL